ncbi:nucleotide exchange factor GrpE [Pseudonocardiaceae bacterium YIM PH 21723]|nr:nucleotide exchange factor GrpE [Pseudonocardiaceae bacterium YIM PH 21723]
MDTAPDTDPTIARLDRIGLLLEEVVEDNTAVTTSMNQLGQSQRALGTDLVRQLAELRRDIATGLTYRTLKDLCVELIGPLGAIEAMLEHADFTEPEAIAGHVRSLAVTLRGVLSRMGAERIGVEVGMELFNPHRHRCVGQVAPDLSPFPDAPARTVTRLLEDGYLLDGRVLIPAAVEIQTGQQAEPDATPAAEAPADDAVTDNA